MPRTRAGRGRDADAGRKLLVPYVTGGLRRLAEVVLDPLAEAGADAIEVGIPFSDPVMDGPVIQAASERALAAGATPTAILDALAGQVDAGVPVAVMTYDNLVFRMGYERFADDAGAGPASAAAILPDLPLEEVGPWAEAADAAGVETVLLAAPTTPDERWSPSARGPGGSSTASACSASPASGTTLAATAVVLARRLKAVTDMPVLDGRRHLHAGAGRGGLRGRRRGRGGLRAGPPGARRGRAGGRRRARQRLPKCPERRKCLTLGGQIDSRACLPVRFGTDPIVRPSPGGCNEQE